MALSLSPTFIFSCLCCCFLFNLSTLCSEALSRRCHGRSVLRFMGAGWPQPFQPSWQVLAPTFCWSQPWPNSSSVLTSSWPGFVVKAWWLLWGPSAVTPIRDTVPLWLPHLRSHHVGLVAAGRPSCSAHICSSWCLFTLLHCKCRFGVLVLLSRCFICFYMKIQRNLKLCYLFYHLSRTFPNAFEC